MKNKLKVLHCPCSILNNISKEVRFPLSKEDTHQINDLLEFVKKEYPTAQGMSAIQVGIEKRFYLVRPHKRWKVIINPEFMWMLGEQLSNESCLSVDPDKKKNIYFKVNRPLFGVIKYYNLNGRKKIKFLSKRIVRIYCHELDHLNGITIDMVGVKFKEVYK